MSVCFCKAGRQTDRQTLRRAEEAWKWRERAKVRKQVPAEWLRSRLSRLFGRRCES